jgi:hypothetical protein
MHMKTVLFAVLLTGLVSCADSKKTMKVERLEGQIQEIEQGLSDNKVGDTIIIKDVYIGGYGTTTHYFGNLRGELPDNWSDTDTSGRVTYSVFYATAIVRGISED